MNQKQKAEYFLKNNMEEIKTLADSLREMPMPLLTEELFALFEKNGNRLQYENVYFTRRKLLAVYGMAVLLFHRPEDLRQLEVILKDICEEPCWALPAHVNRNQSLWQHTVDLFASETAQALAEIMTLGREYLSEKICCHVRRNIEERVLFPFFHSRPPYASWEGCEHNWNAVCAGAIGSACLYLWEGEERLSACMDRLTASLSRYLDGFMEDGACMEGIGYFTYGMTYYTGFAEQLFAASNGERNLLAHPKLKEIAKFQQKMYFKGGRTVSFSDGETKAKFRMGLTLFLSEHYEGVEIPDVQLACGFTTDSCYRFMGLYRDYQWTKQYIERQNGKECQINLPESRHSVLPCAQWSICESSNGVGMAAKGGHNAEPHNHNDIGSFLYLIGEEVLLTDLGAGEYTKQYFGEGRYQILCNSSLGHSVPIINGMEQRAGLEYACGQFHSDGAGATQIEFAAAYEAGLLKTAFRSFRFDLNTGRLEVEDTFVPAGQLSSLTEQLVTQCRVAINGQSATISGKQHKCRITLPQQAFFVRCVEKLHKNHEGIEEKVYLLQWELPIGEKIQTEIQIEPII